jgi:hypothetical protein
MNERVTTTLLLGTDGIVQGERRNSATQYCSPIYTTLPTSDVLNVHGLEQAETRVFGTGDTTGKLDEGQRD